MKCSVDRIEEKVAVIIIKGGGRMEIPVKQFAFSVREGDFFTVDFRKDDAEKRRTKKRIESIREKLLRKTRSRKNTGSGK